MLTIETVPYRGWKRNIRLTNSQVELIVTQEVGPRILRFGFIGAQNVFGELTEQMGGTGEKEWMIRGGHRLWMAPEEKPKSYEPKEISKTTQIFKKKSKIGEKEIGIISTLMNPIESTKEIQITKVKPIQTIQRSSLIQTRMKSNLIPMVSAEMIRPKTQTIRNTPVVKSIQMSSTQLVAPKILQTFESRVRRPIQSSRFRTAQLESPRVKAKTLSKMEKVAQYKGATFSQSISRSEEHTSELQSH